MCTAESFGWGQHPGTMCEWVGGAGGCHFLHLWVGLREQSFKKRNWQWPGSWRGSHGSGTPVHTATGLALALSLPELGMPVVDQEAGPTSSTSLLERTIPDLTRGGGSRWHWLKTPWLAGGRVSSFVVLVSWVRVSDSIWHLHCWGDISWRLLTHNRKDKQSCDIEWVGRGGFLEQEGRWGRAGGQVLSGHRLMGFCRTKSLRRDSQCYREPQAGEWGRTRTAPHSTPTPATGLFIRAPSAQGRRGVGWGGGGTFPFWEPDLPSVLGAACS